MNHVKARRDKDPSGAPTTPGYETCTSMATSWTRPQSPFAERCSHYAWRHKLVPKTCNLSTQKWLERQPLVMRDAVAVEVGGKVLKLTGSGGQSEFLNTANFRMGRNVKPFPSGTWVATCKYANGRNVELPIARRVGNNYEVLPGVVWIMPATRNNPASKVTG